MGHLWRQGGRVVTALAERIAAHGLGDVLSVSGKPCWPLLGIQDTPGATAWEIKTLYLQEMLARGILVQGGLNFSFAHDDTDIDSLLAAYDDVLPMIALAVRDKAMAQFLKCDPMRPVFRVR